MVDQETVTLGAHREIRWNLSIIPLTFHVHVLTKLKSQDILIQHENFMVS